VRGNAEPRQRAELRLVVNVGSVIERRNERGVAHFVEHMAFNGTRNFAEQELVDYLESVGMRFGPDINAYTSFDETVYMLTLPTDSAGVLETGVRILRDWADGIAFDSLEVEKERGVVIEEWRLGQGAGSRAPQTVTCRCSSTARATPSGCRSATRRCCAACGPPSCGLLPRLVPARADGRRRGRRLRRRRDGALDPRGVRVDGRPARRRARAGVPVPSHGRTLISVATTPRRPARAWASTASVRSGEGGTRQSFRRYLVETLYHFMLYDRLAEQTLKQDAPLLSVTSAQGVLVRTQRRRHPDSATVRPERVPEALEALLIESRRVALHGFTHTELARQAQDLLRRWEQIYAERQFTPSAQFAAEYISHFLYGDALLSAETQYEMHRRLLPRSRSRRSTPTAARRGRRARPRRAGHAAEVRQHAAADAALARRRARRQRSRRSVAPYDDDVSELPLVGRPPVPGRSSRSGCCRRSACTSGRSPTARGSC
jgi:zinc protease